VAELKQRLMPPDHWSWTISTPFSQGWRCGDFVFVGGQVSATKDGEVIGAGDIETQTRNVLHAIESVLHEGTATLADVVKLNTFYVCEDGHGEPEDLWERITRVRSEFFPEPGPCGTAVQCSGLAFPDLLIEIEAIAFAPLAGFGPSKRNLHDVED
jgi:2-iminobutanoate/2-iminopropanoate deaminase